MNNKHPSQGTAKEWERQWSEALRQENGLEGAQRLNELMKAHELVQSRSEGTSRARGLSILSQQKEKSEWNSVRTDRLESWKGAYELWHAAWVKEMVLDPVRREEWLTINQCNRMGLGEWVMAYTKGAVVSIMANKDKEDSLREKLWTWIRLGLDSEVMDVAFNEDLKERLINHQRGILWSLGWSSGHREVLEYLMDEEVRENQERIKKESNAQDKALSLWEMDEGWRRSLDEGFWASYTGEMEDQMQRAGLLREVLSGLHHRGIGTIQSHKEWKEVKGIKDTWRVMFSEWEVVCRDRGLMAFVQVIQEERNRRGYGLLSEQELIDSQVFLEDDEEGGVRDMTGWMEWWDGIQAQSEGPLKEDVKKAWTILKEQLTCPRGRDILTAIQTHEEYQALHRQWQEKNGVDAQNSKESQMGGEGVRRL